VKKRAERVERVKIRERRKKIPFFQKRSVRIFIVIASVIVIGVLIYFFLFSKTFAIKEIQVEHDRVTVYTSFHSGFFENLVGKNIFRVSKDDVSEILAQYNTSVRSISLSRQFPSTLIIELIGHPIVARTKWNGNDYYISEDGFLVTSVKDESLVLPFINLYTVAHRFVNDEGTEDESSPLSFGEVFEETFTERVVDPKDLSKILSLLDRFDDEFSLEVLETTYFRVAHEVLLDTLVGTTILFDLTKSLDNQFYKLHAMKKKTRLEDGILSQIDLRIGESKIFYVE
jgi:hypothetical protein